MAVVDQAADEGRRLEGGPGVARAEPIDPLDTPEVEGQGAQDHDDGDGVEGGREAAGSPAAAAARRRPAGRSCPFTVLRPLPGGQVARWLSRRSAGSAGSAGRLRLPPARPRAGSAVLPDSVARFPACRRAPRRRAAASSASSMRQPSAPALSSACFLFFAPGMGTAPLAMIQARATWLGRAPPVRLADAPQDVDDPVHLGHRVVGERAGLRGRVGGGVLAGQPPLADGRVGQRDHAELAAALEQARPSRAWCAGARTRSGCWPAAGPASVARRRSPGFP